MAQWKPLPPGIAPSVRELVVRLRELTELAGISTKELARKSSCRRAAWARWLNGRAVPPRPTVEVFGSIAGLHGTELARLLSLRDVAEQTQTASRAAQSPQAAPIAPIRTPREKWWLRRWPLAGATVGLLVVVAAIGIAVWPSTSEGRPSPASSGGSAGTRDYSCDYSTRDGLRYAGHSTTDSELVMLNAQGHDVVEVQCLLKFHGFDPGGVDGLFGERTEQAVKRLQSEAGVAVDGTVGPQTWGLLRT